MPCTLLPAQEAFVAWMDGSRVPQELDLPNMRGRAPAPSLAQAWRLQVLAASETVALGLSSPVCNTWEGISELAPRPQKDHATQSARLRWAPGRPPGWGARPPRGSFRVGSSSAGGGGPRRGAGRGSERAPPPRARPPAAALGTGICASGAAGGAGGRGRQAGGGDGEGPRAEGAGRSMGGPQAWALLCLGLLLPVGSAAWSVGGAQFSSRR